MSDTTPIGPTLDQLHDASTNLMVARLGKEFRVAMEAGAQLQRYFLAAAAISVPRGVALEILHQTQGARAGSTPTPHDLEAARERVLTRALSGPVPMSDDLRATVKRLVASTQFSPADLTDAVETLRGLNNPWSDERINETLPGVTTMAANDRARPADVAYLIRQATT